jgi:hypothetical protein
VSWNVADATAESRVEWEVDSGATHHILADAAVAGDVKATNMMVMLGNGSRVGVRGICTVNIVTVVGQRGRYQSFIGPHRSTGVLRSALGELNDG